MEVYICNIIIIVIICVWYMQNNVKQYESLLRIYLETQVHSLENEFTVGDLHDRRNGVGEYKKLTTYSI